MSKLTFKPEIGQLVRVVGEDSEFCFYSVGDEGSIVDLPDTLEPEKYAQVKFLRDDKCWWVKLRNLELIF